ncbi:SDR family oxidoreductase [Azospirillum griseum]|uniref:SDR family oxidoreductase n=1 Tax=Azospirillum griseum TaxID=2496639 RepID=A0A431VEX0_9PROT|nr:SDR family oxidoreductase [Azospirillum griseum]RTR18101.1 SDR family oxidoreductase [Azospirillum griseum]
MGTILITGGSRGIGAAIVKRAVADGHSVLFTYHSDRAAADRLVAECDGRAQATRCDVADPAQIAAVFALADSLKARTGEPLTGLVNNAGITGGFARVADLPIDTLRGVLATNVEGCFVAAQLAVQRLSTARGGAGGSIVNLSSQAARLGGGGEWVHYAASKAAVDALTIGLAREVGREGIRVNAVSPGLIDTDIHATAGDPDRVHRLADGVPLGRPGAAVEVADAVAWLLSDRSSYVTGTIIPVSGGR